MIDKLAVWRFSPTGRAFEFGLERTALTFRLQTAANQCRREYYQRDLNLKRPNTQSATAKPGTVHETFKDTTGCVHKQGESVRCSLSNALPYALTSHFVS